MVFVFFPFTGFSHLVHPDLQEISLFYLSHFQKFGGYFHGF